MGDVRRQRVSCCGIYNCSEYSWALEAGSVWLVYSVEARHRGGLATHRPCHGAALSKGNRIFHGDLLCSYFVADSIRGRLSLIPSRSARTTAPGHAEGLVRQ